jgi:hypothetical protein
MLMELLPLLLVSLFRRASLAFSLPFSLLEQLSSPLLFHLAFLKVANE